MATHSNTESEGEVAQSCLTLCDPMDCNLLGFSVHGILQSLQEVILGKLDNYM